jgi:hypothetical protein
VIMLACLAASGCASGGYRPTIEYPKAALKKPADSSYDCAQLDAAILRVDTVRWVIRDDGGRLETTGHRVARYAGNVLIFPLTSGGYLTDGGHAALDAADHRILELLRLKRTRGCPARPTAEADMTDLQMLDVLEPLMPADGSPDRKALDRRTALLDHLRGDLPPPAEAPVPLEAEVPPDSGD